MSVLSCARPDCDNVMCKTYVPFVGYICRDCKNEFKNYVYFQKDIIVDSKSSTMIALEKFMETRKGDYDKGHEVDVDEFFEEYTKDN